MKKILRLSVNILIVVIIISLYVFAFMYLYNDFKERKRKEIANNILKKVDAVIDEKTKDTNNAVTEAEVKYNGFNYTVLGRIKIEKIGINEPILKENNVESYNTALVKVSGPNLNSNGNVVIGGHNFMKGNYLIKINRLVNDDVIVVTNLNAESVKYYVYEYKVTSIDDASYLMQPDNTNDKIITLVTCTKGGKERYYVKARAR